LIPQNNPDITEDTFGLLRSASGKARLLASQKMKQFEGNKHILILYSWTSKCFDKEKYSYIFYLQKKKLKL